MRRNHPNNVNEKDKKKNRREIRWAKLLLDKKKVAAKYDGAILLFYNIESL